MNSAGESAALASEQHHLDQLYRLLDQLRSRTEGLKNTAMRENDGTPAGLFTRDALQYRYQNELTLLNAAEDNLYFGRIDTDEGEAFHIGRMGLADDTPQRDQVLVDWRAPIAAPFYTATALNPQGVVRRRHIRTHRRRITDLSDEFLQANNGLVDESTTDLGVSGDSALIAALEAPRVGRMGDIIATIQAEQDEIIRSHRADIVVVQGGPGTGKTVVALHRAAYLLYTYRQKLGSHGVLVLGPSPTFLEYVGQVLPSLGETSVVLATIGTLLPGITATRREDPCAAVIKGRLNMARVIDHAILGYQKLPRGSRVVPFDRGTVTIDAAVLQRARQSAWASRRPHNEARAVFVRSVISSLAQQVADREDIAQEEGIPLDLAEVRRELATEPLIQAALVDVWPAVSPTALVDELLSDPARLAFAAPQLTATDRAALLRPAGSPWSEADIPLIDEAAELLGEVARADNETQRRLAEELAFARDTLESLGAEEAGWSDSGIAFTLSMLSPEDIARLHDTSGPVGTAADRAMADRSWTYGHVIVDEAQELSPMAWRSVFRRCPLKSMTIVGDVAQTSDPSGHASWAKALNPHARDRWRTTELTVNYRTPGEIMEFAAPVLAAINPDLKPPSSVRYTGRQPWSQHVKSADVTTAVAETAAKIASNMSAGQLAIIYDGDGAELFAAVQHLIPDATDGPGPNRKVVVVDALAAKGLEFDQVIVVEPAALLAAGPRGLGTLYVALTRATQQLGIIHSQPLPDVLDTALLEARS